MGGVQDGRRNTFRNVDFTSADLRGTVYVAAEFSDCRFSKSKLNKINFQSSTFTNCTFEGELREVIFNKAGFKGAEFPQNRMHNVDFSRARLRWTEFHDLDLRDVRFPEDDEHVIVNDFPGILERLLETFRARSDLASRRLFLRFDREQKQLGLAQKVGIFNKADLVEMGGDEGLQTVLDVIANASHGAG